MSVFSFPLKNMFFQFYKVFAIWRTIRYWISSQSISATLYRNVWVESFFTHWLQSLFCAYFQATSISHRGRFIKTSTMVIYHKAPNNLYYIPWTIEGFIVSSFQREFTQRPPQRCRDKTFLGLVKKWVEGCTNTTSCFGLLWK